MGEKDNMNVERIGIFGGTFNPVHIGHLVIAQDAMELLGLSHLLFVPCWTPPHKSASRLVSAEHRTAMLSAAIEGDIRFSVSDVEVRRRGKSYAIDTAREIAAEYPDAELNFIVGSDSLPELHTWKDIYSLLELCRFHIFQRPGHDVSAMTPEGLHLKDPWPRNLLDCVRAGHMMSISSSEIRYRIAEGMAIRYLVHPAVEMYISEHSLYS